jgi:DNA end-binding protein Ku
MDRAFWKGAISFGMVVIPVKMYVATEAHTLSFHMLHKKCLTRPKQVLHCEKDDEYFSSKDTVRGYEYAKDQFIVLDEEDFKKVPVKTAHSISIQGFVDADQVDTIYYQSSHYLEPEELGAKPFALLREVLGKTRRVGIAKVSFQKREHLCALRPLGNIMALHTLYYKNEIADYSELGSGKQELSKSEMEMATSLVDAMSTTFKPEGFKDEYRDALKKLVEAKLKGVEIKPVQEAEVQIPDLMSALKASIEAAKKKKSARLATSPASSLRAR